VACGVARVIRGAMSNVISFARSATNTIINSPVVKTVTKLYNDAYKAYDSMAGWQKAVIGTVGFTAFAVTGGGVAATATMAAMSLATGALTGGIQYAFTAMETGTWDNNQFVEYVVNGAVNDYGLAGAFAGITGVARYIVNNRGRLPSLRDETGEVGFESGSKADTLAQNRINGKAYELQEFSKFSSQNSNAVEQVTIKTKSGVRTRVDAIGIDANGNVVINEFKSSITAPLTNNQKIAFPEIMESGGVVVGKGKGIFRGGYQIPAGTQIKIIRPQ